MRYQTRVLMEFSPRTVPLHLKSIQDYTPIFPAILRLYASISHFINCHFSARSRQPIRTQHGIFWHVWNSFQPRSTTHHIAAYMQVYVDTHMTEYYLTHSFGEGWIILSRKINMIRCFLEMSLFFCLSSRNQPPNTYSYQASFRGKHKFYSTEYWMIFLMQRVKHHINASVLFCCIIVLIDIKKEWIRGKPFQNSCKVSS